MAIELSVDTIMSKELMKSEQQKIGILSYAFCMLVFILIECC